MLMIGISSLYVYVWLRPVHVTMQTRRQPAPVPADSQATLGEHERSILAKYAQDDDEDQEEQQHSPSGEQDDDNDLD